MSYLTKFKYNLLEHRIVFVFLLLFQVIRTSVGKIVLHQFNLLHFVEEVLGGFLSNLFLLMIPYLILRVSIRRYLWFISPVLIISNLFYIIHLLQYKAPISLGAIAVIAETTPGEASEFLDLLGFKTIFFSAVLSLLPLITFLFFKKKDEKYIIQQKMWLFSLIPVYLVLNIFFNFLFERNMKSRHVNIFYKSYIYSDLTQIGYYYRERKKLQQYIEDRVNNKFDVSCDPDQDLNVVLIIGESMSKYHMELYGYDRETTPQLSSLDNLLVFNDVISPASQTRESIIRMLSLAEKKNEKPFYNQGSIIAAARQGGFYTSWFSNQMMLGISDTETSVVAKDANYTKFINSDWKSASLDGKLLPHLKTALGLNESNKNFIVLHMLGNHFKYENRYPVKDNYFFDQPYLFPTYIDNDKQEMINHYDNSIRYSDRFIYDVIELVKESKRPSVVIYLSDHGEELYDDENLYIGHGSPDLRKEAIDIPFLIWCSPEYLKSNDSLDFNRFVDNEYNSGNLFHTLADVMSLSFDEYDASKSILNPDFVSRERFVINSNNKLINYKDIE